jgi:tRNA/rRNA methyltransferase
MIIVLVRPQLPENIGAVARAMLNFNVRELRIVSEDKSLLNTLCYRNSAGADVVLDHAIFYHTLEAAVQDMHMVYGTIAKPRDIVTCIETPESLLMSPIQHKFGIVFGPERTGLTHEDIKYCNAMIQIPTNSDFSSLNLAQAVLLICYTYFQKTVAMPQSAMHLGKTNLATSEERQKLLVRAEELLDTIDYWRVPTKKPVMLRNFQSLLNRTPITSQDVRSLLGIVDRIFKNLLINSVTK